MELLVKLYSGQPPRLGIKHTYEYQAIKTYEDLVRTMEGEDVTAVIELSRNGIELCLTSVFNGRQVRYKSLEYKAGDLQKLRTLDPGKPLTFVHIFPQSNTMLVAKPFRRATFLTITSLELRGAEFMQPET
jgi:hypothetical protein